MSQCVDLALELHEAGGQVEGWGTFRGSWERPFQKNGRTVLRRANVDSQPIPAAGRVVVKSHGVERLTIDYAGIATVPKSSPAGHSQLPAEKWIQLNGDKDDYVIALKLRKSAPSELSQHASDEAFRVYGIDTIAVYLRPSAAAIVTGQGPPRPMTAKEMALAV